MPISQNGQVNLSSLSVPDFYLLNVPPSNNLINGVPTNILGIVGTATWGPKNSPLNVGDLTEQVQNFGQVKTNKFDMGTAAQSAFLQGANNVVCVRVTDGTDVSAFSSLLDSASIDIIGAKLTAIYTGTTGNTLQVLVGKGSSYTPTIPTYRVSIALPNSTPEIFDNIGGTGLQFWQNLVNAINQGQGSIRPPSQLVVATLGNGVGAINITNGGSNYTTPPIVGFTGGGGGSGAAATSILGFAVATATVVLPGSGYTTATVSATGGGGTGFAATANITAGSISSITITSPGAGYTSAPILTILGNGTGATATAVLSLTGSIIAITLTVSGSAYTSAPIVGFTGGGGTGAAATAIVGSVEAPKQLTYQFASGTDGISGVTAATLVGSDVVPRTGMYALRNTTASVVILADVDDTTTWSLQDAYGLSEGSYMMLVGASGQSIASAISAKQTAGIDSYSSKVILGDWVYFNDTINNQLRVISPQGFIGGVLVSLSPEQSSLNKPMEGIVATQTSYQNKIYSQADLKELALSGIDVISKPLPRGNVFGGRFGRNSSSQVILHGDNYTRMTYFLELTLNSNLGLFVGLPQTKEVRRSAKDTLQSFLQNLKTLEMIDDFSVVLDDSNNPQNLVALGNMIADVKVRYLSIIDYFIVRLEGGQSVVVQKQSTLPAF